MKISLKGEKGLTLIEVLMVMSISAIIAGVAYSILFTSMTSTKSTLSDTSLRNEAVLVTQQLDSIMKNIDTINTAILETPLTKIDFSNKITNLDLSGKLQSKIQTFVLEVRDDNLWITERVDGVTLQSKPLNTDTISMEGSTLKVTEFTSGSKKRKALQVNFRFTETKSGKEKEIIKVYRLQGE